MTLFTKQTGNTPVVAKGERGREGDELGVWG